MLVEISFLDDFGMLLQDLDAKILKKGNKNEHCLFVVCLNARKGFQKNNEKNSNVKRLCENKGKCLAPE